MKNIKPEVKPYRGKRQVFKEHPELEMNKNELVLSNQTLKESNKLVNLILQSISLGMNIVDEHGNILFLNKNLGMTDRKLHECQLKASQVNAEESNREKSAFMVSMNHEIRTPMNAIMGFSDLIMEAEGDEKKQFATIIQKCSRQLLSLLDDVLCLSRLHGEKLPIDNIRFKPAELVTDVYRMFNLPHIKKELDIALSIPMQYEDLVMLSDANKIRQVITNLVANAVKYTIEGSVTLGFELQDELVEFYVTDTGIGIPEKEQERIFESFYRSEQAISSAIEGTGLGLSIAKELVELMGGVIGVSSRLNMGSHFFFLIPLEKSGKMNTGKPLLQMQHKQLKDFTILVAEDELVSYQYIEILLKGKVKRIDHATNGKEAVEFAIKNSYNLILMDLKMPVMGGLEAAKILKQQFPAVPIIAQTAYSSTEVKERALKSGCVDILTKPFKRRELIEMINRYA
ncbi:MAG: ATP-binding protein [Prolixibacteraceae bacterium]|nr:ATP-binding protein [Prolixibacteraceae bacterium]